MAIVQGNTEPHWTYLLALEADLERLSRFVEFAPANFTTYSIEIARLLMSAGAEVDVVCKQLCHTVNPNSTASNIHQYRDMLNPAFPMIQAFDVEVPRFGLQLFPWEEWKQASGVPLWWNAVNKTKHQRHSHFDHANLKNALNALAGLFVVTLYLYRQKAIDGELRPTPRLIRAGSEFLAGQTSDGYDFAINYAL